MNDDSTTLFLIRHGQIEANVDRHWHGSTDSHLNALGKRQAESMAEFVTRAHPEICTVYCSPMQRTMDTASPLAARLGVDLIPEDRLREYGIGELEGTPYEDLADVHGFFEKIRTSQDYAPPGGESPNQVCLRIVQALEQLRARHVGEAVAVVSHGAAMGIALTHLLEHRVFPFHDYHMVNTGYSKLVWAADPSLEFFNRSVHLND